MDFRGLVLFSISVCFHVGLTLRCACREKNKYCTSFHQMSVDFKTAEENCTAMGGKLPMRWNDTVLLNMLNENGHFWIGAKDKCSGTNVRGDSPRSVSQARKDMTCSSQCMALSSNRTQTERPCKERTNGFFCEGVPWESCWMENPSEATILSENNCLLAPCEHRCRVAPGGVGYVCTCYPGYRLSIRGPRYCSYGCSSGLCEPKCRKGNDPLNPTNCICPDGFIKDEKQCADIDECASNHNCAQNCTNTMGSYTCSCGNDFMLVNRSECVSRFRSSEGDPPITGVLRPSMNYTTSHASFSTPGGYIGITLFIVLALAALIVLLYYLRRRKSNVHLNTYGELNDVKDCSPSAHMTSNATGDINLF